VSVAALYDIHGNLPALDAVIAELEREPPDAVVVGGDVAAGPLPNEVLARLHALPWPVHWLRGNADRALVMSFDRKVFTEVLGLRPSAPANVNSGIEGGSAVPRLPCGETCDSMRRRQARCTFSSPRQ
jgi:hypothetical protein